MNSSPLELLAKKYENVVKYDDSGNVAGIFVKFPKMKSSDLVAGLPNHTHPAFIINGEEQDYILLGKHKASDNGVTNGPFLSLPNMWPRDSASADYALGKMRAAGPGISGMTVADYGFIKLLAQKNGWAPKGNTAWGQSHKDATAWTNSGNITANARRAYAGYLYKALQSHTSSSNTRPDIAPTYWEKLGQIGGINNDRPNNTSHGTGYHTLNGSGPLEWYLGCDPGNMADLIGSCNEAVYGYRLYDSELQILPDNDAADPEADLSAESEAWKAILPNANDTGHTLVAPGTAGTLHWNWTGSAIQLDTQCDYLTIGQKSQAFNTLTAHSTRLPYVPAIVKELGLFPTDQNDATEGYFDMTFWDMEAFFWKGGMCEDDTHAGLGQFYIDDRGNFGTRLGYRPRSL